MEIEMASLVHVPILDYQNIHSIPIDRILKEI